MGDNKEYIVNSEENGNVSISEDVIAIVAAAAVVDVEGAAGLSTTIGKDIADLFGKKNVSKGIKIQIDEDATVIDAYVMIAYGYNVMEVSKKIQDAIKSAVESMTGLKV